MVASLSNHNTYFSSPLTYQVQRSVSQAGGNQAQANLLNFLLSPSITAFDQDTDKSFALHDCRAGESLLLIFPPRLQILLSIILNQTEHSTFSNFKDRYDLVSFIKSPKEICLLHQDVTRNQIGSSFLTYLNKPNLFDSVALETLFGLKDTSCFDSNKGLRGQLEALFSANPNVSNPDSFIDTVVSNDRQSAVIHLAQRFNFPSYCIQSLVNTTELWLLQNSFI